jgi:hypothetical protein
MITRDFSSIFRRHVQLTADEVTVAKLHVLQIQPIKERLGDKWNRLSTLVHKLFENALGRTQRAGDRFYQLDELSYIATFSGRSQAEASLACAAVAKEVCELLFGDEVHEISVRNLIAAISRTTMHISNAKDLETLLEERGHEVVTTHQPASESQFAAPSRERMVEHKIWIQKAHLLARAAGRIVTFAPVWDLKKQQSSSLFLTLRLSAGDQRLSYACEAATEKGEYRVVEAEIAFLFAAAAYAHRISEDGQVSAIGVGVSYESLSGFNTRIKYISALKSLQSPSRCPLLLKIQQIPEGTPLGRLAEIIAMLNSPGFRILVELPPRTLPDLDIRLGASGIGTILRQDIELEQMAVKTQLLWRRACEQKAFAFLGGLANEHQVRIASQHNIKLGMGSALDEGRYYTGLEAIPALPLVRTNYVNV